MLVSKRRSEIIRLMQAKIVACLVTELSFKHEIKRNIGQ